MALIIFFTAVVAMESTYIYCAVKKGFSNDTYKNDKLSYIDKLYRENFVGEIDEEALTDSLIRGYLAGVGEKYGAYYTADEYADYQASLEGSLVGIGVTVIYDGESGCPKVTEVIENSPAMESGILAGDLIYKVDGSLSEDLGYNNTIAAVKGAEGTKVNITVKREGKELSFDIERREVETKCVYYHMYEASDIGIIRITRFATVAGDQFEDALNALKALGAKKLVFDLRDNPGGDLESVSKILDILLPEGDIVIVTDKDGNKSVAKKSDANDTDMPMAVLVNGNSASASELFAANIRDYDKGAIIGTTTFGKGTMQSIIPMSDGSCIVISYRMFASKSGVNYEGVGIKPDITVEPNEKVQKTNFLDLEDKDDNQLMEAVKYLSEK